MQHTTEVRIYVICNRASCKCFKSEDAKTSLVVEWLRLRLPMQGVWVQSLGQGTRYHMLQLRIHMSKLQIDHATTNTWHIYIYIYIYIYIHIHFMHAQSLQSCPALCDPMDCSPPGSSVHGILQAIILEWVTMPFSRYICMYIYI